ncbi:MAG: hemolysin III family protein [Flavobacteriales bacterium]|nr:hemolysin III family protein [Flavobacteriales bacterium]
MNSYSYREELVNITSHAIGFVLSIVALVFLLIQSITFGGVYHIVSVSIFGVSLMVLYAASTLYHSSKQQKLRNRLKIFDHAAIYLLIAGTYTPFTLVSLKGSIGWVFFGITWGMVVLGVVLKLFYTGKFKLVSTLLYLFMGWMVLFIIKPLNESVAREGLYWLFAGGLAYTIGAISYSIKRIEFNHAFFHICVLIGSFCHFISIFYYILPSH